MESIYSKTIPVRDDYFVCIFFVAYHILFSTAFIFEKKYFLVVPFYIFVFSLYQIYFYKFIARDAFLWSNSRLWFILGAWCCGYAIDFIWIFLLKQINLELDFITSLMGFFILILTAVCFEFFSLLLNRLLFYGQKKIYRISLFSGLSFLKYWLLQKHFFIILGQNKGFNLLNPLLPILLIFWGSFPPVHWLNFSQIFIYDLPYFSKVSDEYDSKIKLNELYSSIIKIKQRKLSKTSLFLAPEAFLRYDLPHTPYAKDLVLTCLSATDFVCFGAYVKNNGHWYQSLWSLSQQSGEVAIHKKLLCPFFEELSFKANDLKSYDDRVIKIAEKKFLLILCSELFLANQESSWPQADAVLVFVKEKFFSSYFYKIMLTHAVWTSIIHRKKIIWIDYSGLRIINFSGIL